ncbi:hypothetical protein [Micromonospora sp. WMMD737]|uniref:hypothetical protein n=1 Tax=Micromonospora sp. WMMD737 TaxID=3404113 RepID=UPI003B93E628
MTDTGQPRTAEEYAAQRMRQRIESIARDLIDLADTVRRQGPETMLVGGPGRESYGDIASRVQREVMNALPNLGLDALTGIAANADIARAKGE